MKTNGRCTYVTLLSVALSLLAGCSSEELTDSKSLCPTSSFITKSLSGGTTLSDDNFANNETVWFWANRTSNGNAFIEAWKLTADGLGNFNGTAHYWPTDGDNLNVMAVHGNFTETIVEGSTAYPTTLTHTVVANQGTDADRRLSDLLYADATNQSHSSPTIGMTFSHLLSKITIVLKATAAEGVEAGVSDAFIKGFELKLNGVTQEVTVDFQKKEATSKGTPGTISMGVLKDEGTDHTATAIIPPQKVSAGTQFVELKLNDFPKNGESRTFHFVNKSDMTFYAENEYVFTFDVANFMRTVPTDIDDWETSADSEHVLEWTKYFTAFSVEQWNSDVRQFEWSFERYMPALDDWDNDEQSTEIPKVTN